MPDCQHLNKVYSGEAFMSSPPQWAWRCPDCIEGGTTTAVRCPGEIDMLGYADVIEKEEPSFAAMLRRLYKARVVHAR